MAAEKCTRQLPPIRVSDSLEMALMRLAMRFDMTPSAYVRRVLEKHCFGHAFNDADQEPRASEFGAMRD